MVIVEWGIAKAVSAWTYLEEDYRILFFPSVEHSQVGSGNLGVAGIFSLLLDRFSYILIHLAFSLPFRVYGIPE